MTADGRYQADWNQDRATTPSTQARRRTFIKILSAGVTAAAVEPAAACDADKGQG
jgi:hypothetical protein